MFYGIIGDMAVRLFIQELAREKGHNMTSLHFDARIPISTMQRYWHGVGVDGKPLQAINLTHLDALCRVLGCEVGDILRRVPDDGESEGSNAD